MTNQIRNGICLLVLLFYCAKTLFAQSINADSLLIDREKTKWEALKTGNFGAHPEWYAPDFVSIGYLPDASVYRTGIGKPQPASTSKSTFPPATFVLSGFKVVTASPTVRIITYQAEGPLNLYVTTVWAERESKWKSVFYQATRYK